MRLDTVVWMKFESKGKPEATQVMGRPLIECLKALAQWIGSTPMGHCMKITVARSQAELEKLTREGGKMPSAARDEIMSELMGELDSILGQASNSAESASTEVG